MKGCSFPPTPTRTKEAPHWALTVGGEENAGGAGVGGPPGSPFLSRPQERAWESEDPVWGYSLILGSP